MKKFRRTKITVRTRETLICTAEAAGEGEQHFCPLCQAPLIAPFTATANTCGPEASTQNPKQLGPSVETDIQIENEFNEPGAENGRH